MCASLLIATFGLMDMDAAWQWAMVLGSADASRAVYQSIDNMPSKAVVTASSFEVELLSHPNASMPLVPNWWAPGEALSCAFSSIEDGLCVVVFQPPPPPPPPPPLPPSSPTKQRHHCHLDHHRRHHRQHCRCHRCLEALLLSHMPSPSQLYPPSPSPPLPSPTPPTSSPPPEENLAPLIRLLPSWLPAISPALTLLCSRRASVLHSAGHPRTSHLHHTHASRRQRRCHGRCACASRQTGAGSDAICGEWNH